MPGTLRKSDLVGRVAAKMGATKTAGEAALNAVVAAIQEALAGGNRVVITGFGSFEVREVKARKVRAIRGGKTVSVPSHKRVGFTPGAELAGSVRRK